MAMLTDLRSVKAYLAIPTSDTRWDDLLGGEGGGGVNLIEAASAKFEQATNRKFSLSSNNTTYTFSTEGQSDLLIPDLQLSPTPTVTLLGAALTANASFWLIPDPQDRATTTHIQLKSFGIGQSAYWYKAFPNWFDANLDRYPFFEMGSPLDLAITGTWGHLPIPDDVIFAVTILTSWFFKRKDAIPTNLIFNPDGSTSDMHDWPTEVLDAVHNWRLRQWVTAIR